MLQPNGSPRRAANCKPNEHGPSFAMPHIRKVSTLVAVTVITLLAACSQSEARNTTASASRIDSLPDSVLVSRADRGRTLGADSAPIWIVMISDFQCPYCKQFHDDGLKNVLRDFVETGKARFAYLHLPLPQHPHSRPAARASLCASAQGKFFEYADSVFAAQQRLGAIANSGDILATIGRQIGLDQQAFAHCQKSAAIENMIRIDEQQAARANIRSTPSFFVGDYLLEGLPPYATFRTAVDSALALAARKRAR